MNPPERRRRNRRRRTRREVAPPKPKRSWQERRALAVARSRAFWLVARGPLGLVASALVLFAAGSGAVAVGRLVERYVRSAEAFRTTSIEVDGMTRLTREQVLEAAGLAIGRNVFDVSPDEAGRRLARHPWVARAEIARRLPGRFRVRIEERRAAAILMLERAYLASDDAVVFKPLERGDPSELPVVRGLEAVEPVDRRPTLASAIALIDEYRKLRLQAQEPLREIHVDPDHGFVLLVGADATEVRLGHAPFGRKLVRFRRVLDRLRNEGSRPEYVVLDAVRRPNRVAVRVR